MRARVSGILVKQFYREGDPVREGAPLFEIDRAPFEVALAQAKGQLAQATAQLAQGQREEARLKPLVADRAVSRKEYDDATSTLELAQAAVQLGDAAVRQARAQPVVHECHRACRRHQRPRRAFDRNADQHRCRRQSAHNHQPADTDLGALQSGRSRSCQAPRWPPCRARRPADVQLVLPDGSLYATKGRLNFAATAIDTQLGTQQLRAEFDNRARAASAGPVRHACASPPASATTFSSCRRRRSFKPRSSIWCSCVDAEGKAQAGPVKTGDWIGTDWAIMSGLNAGDRVIVDNLLKIQPGIAVVEAPAAAPRQCARRDGRLSRPPAMSFSEFFINRPIFAGVISIIITLGGLIAAQVLPVAQYPEIAPPTVIITANYPGASADTLARTVAAPIEEQLSGVDNLIYFSSTAATNGTLTIACTFEVGSNADKAVIDVNNRVAIALPRLPDVVRQTGVVALKRSTDILLVIGLSSDDPRYDTLYSEQLRHDQHPR